MPDGYDTNRSTAGGPLPPPPAPGGVPDGPSRPAPGGEPAGVPAAAGHPGFDDSERRLAQGALTAWRISAALFTAPPAAFVAILAVVFLDVWGWVVVGVALGLFAFVVGWLQGVRYARWRWQLTDGALKLRHGVIVHVEEYVPYFRIQQIDLAQGPVDRMLGLTTLQVTTASASGSATIPGVAASDAPAIRVELLRRASEAVARHPGDVRDAV